jgi:hypothetical protein
VALLEQSQEPSTQHPVKHTTTTAVIKGKWEKGKSGNPKGRPLTASRPRDIVTLKSDLELAVRDQLSATKVTQIVNRMISIATDHPDTKAAIAAAKLILDMAVSKAAVQEAVAQRAPINIIIENATLSKHSENEPIEARYEHVN